MIRRPSPIIVLSLIMAFAVPSQAQTQHSIVLIKELVSDVTEARWTDQSQGELLLGVDSPSRGFVSNGFKKGLIRSADPSVPDAGYGSDPIEAPAIDVRLKTAPGLEKRSVRGGFTLQLPDLKLLQLEVDYDLLLNDAKEEVDAEFFVEVYERDAKNASGWSKSGEVHQVEHTKKWQSRRVLALQSEEGKTKELFISRSFNADLSKWAGKEVQLVLAAESPFADGRTPGGRWTQARLMGATFSYKIGGE